MKFIYLLIAFISLSLNGHSQINPSEFGLNKTWTIVEWDKYTKKELVEKKISLSINNEGELSIYTGCNTLFWHLKKYTKDSLLFSDFIMTQINCLNHKNIEKELVQTIQLIYSYKIHANEIVFVLEDKTTIKAVAETKQ